MLDNEGIGLVHLIIRCLAMATPFLIVQVSDIVCTFSVAFHLNITLDSNGNLRRPITIPRRLKTCCKAVRLEYVIY